LSSDGATGGFFFPLWKKLDGDLLIGWSPSSRVFDDAAVVIRGRDVVPAEEIDA